MDEKTDTLTRIIGLVGRHMSRPQTDSKDDQHWADQDEAARLAQALGDASLAAWVNWTAARQLIRTQRPERSLPYADAARLLVELPDFAGFGPFLGIEPRWLESTDVGAATRLLRHYTWSTVRLARRYNGDLDGWLQAVDMMTAVAKEALDYRPSLLLAALISRYDLQRKLGDQADLSELVQLRTQSYMFDEAFMAQSGYNAAVRGDHSGALEFFRQRAEMILNRMEPDLVDKTPNELAELFAERPIAKLRPLNPLANTAFELASNLFDSGRTELYAEDRDLALAWLRVAEMLWREWATNGYRAAMARRAYFELPSNPDAVLTLIQIAREAPLAALRVNVMRRAAKGATSHKAQILQQLEDMLTEPWEAYQRATLLTSHAWLQREKEGEDADRAEEYAHHALSTLANRSVGKIEVIAMAEGVLTEISRWRGNSEQEAQSHRGAVSAIARMLLNATTYEQRLRVAREWAPSIRAALSFAELHSDAELADLVHEIVRRDGIGALLSQMSESVLAPADVASIAQDVTTAGRTDARQLVDDESDMNPDSDADSIDEVKRGLTRDAGEMRITARDEQAYAQAQQILGHLGSLVDPGTLYSAQASTVLDASPHKQNVYLLQLLPSSIEMVGSDGGPVLYRRLTWTDGNGRHELVDSVALPDGLRDEPEAGDLYCWSDASPLLPDPLSEALERATVDSPVRLMIVPTALFHIEFDGLRTGSFFLIQRASITVHTSLTAAMHSLDNVRPWDRAAGSYGVFDIDALPATKTEKFAVERHFKSMQELATKAKLYEAFMTSSPALLAIGVHGYDDDAGWGQTKLLPNGETLSAAEALGLSFPEVCVLASCNSRVRQHGVDHAGFITAMFARGATTVIGSIGLLYDVETSEILAEFYGELERTGDPVRSLRAARLNWIAQDPDHRWYTRELWSRLVLYGGAHY
ncbi:CHAT domain-containing protein [Cryobacterium sp. TMT2-10]|uniref:CHAT domain-containing protein n=1 Tax=Cryobacterium sp. TMT2-10 TaxID=1259244 RepID=UPI00141A6FB5|nr:CHAT domain-containing protein [Cryobacterium sp. TMT2-10]